MPVETAPSADPSRAREAARRLAPVAAFEPFAPRELRALVSSSRRRSGAVRAVEGALLDDGRCLVRVARHFKDTWRDHAKPPRTRSQRIRERDLHRCQVPGCGWRAVHAHHVVPRSRGGTDGRWNLVALCACHHLRGEHGGFLRVRGEAPGALAWEVRAGAKWVPFRPGDAADDLGGPVAVAAAA